MQRNTTFGMECQSNRRLPTGHERTPADYSGYAPVKCCSRWSLFPKLIRSLLGHAKIALWGHLTNILQHQPHSMWVRQIAQVYHDAGGTESLLTTLRVGLFVPTCKSSFGPKLNVLQICVSNTSATRLKWENIDFKKYRKILILKIYLYDIQMFINFSQRFWVSKYPSMRTYIKTMVHVGVDMK